MLVSREQPSMCFDFLPCDFLVMQSMISLISNCALLAPDCGPRRVSSVVDCEGVQVVDQRIYICIYIGELKLW